MNSSLPLAVLADTANSARELNRLEGNGIKKHET